jgi:hypothetical protein
MRALCICRMYIYMYQIKKDFKHFFAIIAILIIAKQISRCLIIKNLTNNYIYLTTFLKLILIVFISHNVKIYN